MKTSRDNQAKYLRRVAVEAVRRGMTLEAFVDQFKPEFREVARRAFEGVKK